MTAVLTTTTRRSREYKSSSVPMTAPQTGHDSRDRGQGTQTWTYVGVCLGAVFVVSLIVSVVIYLYRRHRLRKRDLQYGRFRDPGNTTTGTPTGVQNGLACQWPRRSRDLQAQATVTIATSTQPRRSSSLHVLFIQYHVTCQLGGPVSSD
ncbi:hypothetical protein C0Q70_14614 [Pomacea canaliculata]|uniref:Uncharacterized protein n=1 Tax=Pomacea canaliculata TaxID=400727 RepID=A0A2T7NSJ3_POMCA|nr:hypothetical protein C0Q70_14614 [Pomacea canaliculata]